VRQRSVIRSDAYAADLLIFWAIHCVYGNEDDRTVEGLSASYAYGGGPYPIDDPPHLKPF
jgi:hypothetical protein